MVKLISKSSLNKANKKVLALLVKLVKTKSGGNKGRPIRRVTGNLLRSLDTVIEIDGDKLVLNMNTIEYFKYLDKGTDVMKGWFITEELTESSEFKNIIRTLLVEGVTKKLTLK